MASRKLSTFSLALLLLLGTAFATMAAASQPGSRDAFRYGRFGRSHSADRGVMVEETFGEDGEPRTVIEIINSDEVELYEDENTRQRSGIGYHLGTEPSRYYRPSETVRSVKVESNNVVEREGIGYNLGTHPSRYYRPDLMNKMAGVDRSEKSKKDSFIRLPGQ